MAKRFVTIENKKLFPFKMILGYQHADKLFHVLWEDNCTTLEPAAHLPGEEIIFFFFKTIQNAINSKGTSNDIIFDLEQKVSS